MDNEIPEINELIQQFSKLPGLGPKSAKRIILKLINNKDNMVKPLAKSLAEVYKKVVRCVDCGNLKIIDKVCICSSDNSYDKICVVENLADMWVIDSANIYKGHYHILGGTLNSNENYEQKNLQLNINKAKSKVQIILATITTFRRSITQWINKILPPIFELIAKAIAALSAIIAGITSLMSTLENLYLLYHCLIQH